jgi:peptidoglycan hydrolase-like protein with peptidoglycan-binding domain
MYIESQELVMNQGPTLRKGSTGDEVKRAQRILVMIQLLDFRGIDGIFGTKTERAVRSFQLGQGLTEDGIIGPATWSALPANPGTEELHLGSRSRTVQALQRGLIKFRGADTKTDPGNVDGVFGPNTEAAVIAYQAVQSITADGIVGDLTWWVPAGAAGTTLAALSELTTV